MSLGRVSQVVITISDGKVQQKYTCLSEKMSRTRTLQVQELNIGCVKTVMKWRHVQ